MTLLKTALKNLRKKPAMNLICLLQLTAVFLITAVMISAMSIRYRTYTPIKSILESKGFFVTYLGATHGALKPNGDFDEDVIFSSDGLLEYVNADKVLLIHKHTMFYQDEAAATYLYDRELIKRYTPELKRGRWISPDADEIEIVIPDGLFGADVGDELEVTLFNWRVIPPIKVRVVGVLEDTAKVLGEPRYGKDIEDSYRRLYRSADDFGMPAVMASTDAVQRICPQASALFICSAFFMYDDVTAEDLKQDMRLTGQMNGQEILSLEELNQNSRAYLKKELLKLLPVTVILFILVIISSISVSAISARQRLRDYAKYYVLGLQWRQCALVNLFQALTVGAAALVIAFAGLVTIGATELSDTFMIIWNVPLFLSLLGVLALYLAFSMIMPLLMLRSTTPKALLQTE